MQGEPATKTRAGRQARPMARMAGAPFETESVPLFALIVTWRFAHCLPSNVLCVCRFFNQPCFATSRLGCFICGSLEGQATRLDPPKTTAPQER